MILSPLTLDNPRHTGKQMFYWNAGYFFLKLLNHISAFKKWFYQFVFQSSNLQIFTHIDHKI